jgi:hypothetical protein
MRRWKPLSLLCFVIADALTCTAIPVRAQQPALAADEKRLETPVRLNMGATTLNRIMAQLSAQTGLTIQAADYLRERRLTVQMEGLTAREALDALAELHDWTWSRVEPGRYLLKRRVIRRPGLLEDIPRMMQIGLPRDLRAWLRLPALPKDDPSETTSLPHHASLISIARDQKNRLLFGMEPLLRKRETIAVSELQPEPHTRLLIWLLLQNYGSLQGLLHDDFGVQSIRPAAASLWLEPGGVMLIGMYRGDQHLVSFGGNVSGAWRER